MPLEPDDIREIHNIMLERYSGLPGEHEPGLIDFMAQKPFQEVFGVELYPGLFLKAAVYMHGFATNQYFADGNKRTAYGCTANFLEINGYYINISDNLLYTMTMSVARKRTSLETLALLLERHSVFYF